VGVGVSADINITDIRPYSNREIGEQRDAFSRIPDFDV